MRDMKQIREQKRAGTVYGDADPELEVDEENPPSLKGGIATARILGEEEIDEMLDELSDEEEDPS